MLTTSKILRTREGYFSELLTLFRLRKIAHLLIAGCPSSLPSLDRALPTCRPLLPPSCHTLSSTHALMLIPTMRHQEIPRRPHGTSDQQKP